MKKHHILLGLTALVAISATYTMELIENERTALERIAKEVNGEVMRAPLSEFYIFRIKRNGQIITPRNRTLLFDEEKLFSVQEHEFDKATEQQLLNACSKINFRKFFTLWCSIPVKSQNKARLALRQPLRRLMRIRVDNILPRLFWGVVTGGVYTNKIWPDEQKYLAQVFAFADEHHMHLFRAAWSCLDRDRWVEILPKRPPLPDATASDEGSHVPQN